jgi:5-methylcytosine-specific restriction protein A
VTGRNVPLWVGATPDAAIPARVKLRIWEREGGRCSLTGRKIQVGEAFDYEHRIPLSMGGRHAEDNIVLALRVAHREKTAQEAGVRAKADRIRLKNLGLWPKSRTPLRSRGFQRTRPAVIGMEGE